jgi:hypothetical protein
MLNSILVGRGQGVNGVRGKFDTIRQRDSESENLRDGLDQFALMNNLSALVDGSLLGPTKSDDSTDKYVLCQLFGSNARLQCNLHRQRVRGERRTYHNSRHVIGESCGCCSLRVVRLECSSEKIRRIREKDEEIRRIRDKERDSENQRQNDVHPCEYRLSSALMHHDK